MAHLKSQWGLSNITIKIKKTIVLLLIVYSGTSSADDKAIAIVDHSVNAYGGNQLLELKSLTFQSSHYEYLQWQSSNALQGEMVSYLNQEDIEYNIDFVKNNNEFKQATHRIVGSHSASAPSIKHYIFKNGEGLSIDHALLRYQPSKRITFQSIKQTSEKLLDTLVIKRLHKERSNAQWTDSVYIQGKAHHVLTINANTPDQYLVFLDEATGYLSRMVINVGGKKQSYDFWGHTKTSGITWAKRLFIGDESRPIHQSRTRNVTVNKVTYKAFNIHDKYRLSTAPKYHDVSTLTVEKLAENIYFAGQEWGYTLFIDIGDSLISAGAWQMAHNTSAWKNALTFFRKTTGINKPLKKHIITHHHTDHMMGLKDVLSEGAKLILHSAHIKEAQEFLGNKAAAKLFTTIEDTSYIEESSIMLFDLPTSHANHNLAIYLPKEKILFTEDIFGSSYKDAFHSPIRWPDGDTYFRLEKLIKRIHELGLDVETFVSSHHGRVLNAKEIKAALSIERPASEVLLPRLFKENG
jgi:glyoxylase-like metal-dependent hydrolase (beta-lactamase superfamily II)